MSASESSSAPAGWYADPEYPGRGRYWDGAAWTEHLHTPGQPAPILRAPAGTDPNTVWIWILVALPVLGYIPLLFFPWAGYLQSVVDDASTGDPGVLGSQFALFTSPAYLATIVLSLFSYGATVLLAYLDHRALLARGVPKPFHWALAFIPSYGYLVYIIGRTVVVKRRTDRGLGPIWGTIGVFVAGLIAGFVIAAQLMYAMTSLFSTLR